MSRITILKLFIGPLLLLITGCNIDLSKTTEETDTRVYEIIDSQWDDTFGVKPDYRISNNSIVPSVESCPQNNVITILKAVQLATRQNRDYHTEKENLYLSALDFTEVRHVYEPMPFLREDVGYRQDDYQEGIGGFGSLGFEQLLASGAYVLGDVSLGWVDIISGDLRSGFSLVASAMITQPLLRGAGRKVALENLTQAERNTLYQVRTFNRFRKVFIVSIISDYYYILQLNDFKNNSRDHYNALSEIHTKLQKRVGAGKVPLHELEQAEQDRLEAFSVWIQARELYENALDQFKLKLALRANQEVQLDMNEFEVLRLAVGNDIAMMEEQAVKVALSQRLDLANAADIVIDAERKVDVAADAIRAELNLIGYANPQSSERTVFGAEPGELDETRDRYQLSMMLDLPIDRLVEKNAYRRALITLMQFQRSHQETTDTVVLEVRRSYRQMQEAYERYLTNQSSRILAQKRTENTLLLLKYDRANTRDVLDAREDFYEAQNDETRAMVDYAVASLEFLRDTGTMKILPDGIWDEYLTPDTETSQETNLRLTSMKNKADHSLN